MQGMDVHYLKPPEADLKAAMDQYTICFDAQMAASLAQNLAQPKAAKL